MNTSNDRELIQEKARKDFMEYYGFRCPHCRRGLIERESKSGFKFVGCLGFPRCKFTSIRVRDNNRGSK